MTDVRTEMPHVRTFTEHSEVFAPDAPNWLRRAMTLYDAHNIPNDERDLQGQYTENRMFIRRLERERQSGLFSPVELRDMEEAFAQACAQPEGDPMLALELLYLKHFDARQPQRRPVQQSLAAGM